MAITTGKNTGFSLAVRFCIALIRLYQRWISPRLGACCRFEPSCSRYAVEAFEVHGFFRGLWLTFWRLWRCRPGFARGTDLVPMADYFALPTFEKAEEFHDCHCRSEI